MLHKCDWYLYLEVTWEENEVWEESEVREENEVRSRPISQTNQTLHPPSPEKSKLGPQTSEHICFSIVEDIVSLGCGEIRKRAPMNMQEKSTNLRRRGISFLAPSAASVVPSMGRERIMTGGTDSPHQGEEVLPITAQPDDSFYSEESLVENGRALFINLSLVFI